MAWRIFVTRPIPSDGIAMLRKTRGVILDVYEKDDIIPRAELLRRVKGASAILSILTDKIDDDVLGTAGPQLKIVANYAVGFDNVDLAAAKKRGIFVSNAPHPHVSEAVAEHAIALIFGLAHRIVEVDAFARAGKYHGWEPQMLLGTTVMGKTLGIVGGGAIGSMLARRLHDGFGITIVYTDIRRNDELEKKYGAKHVSLPALLKTADFVSLHVPLLPSTHHLIGAKQFRTMKKTSFLVNTSRGPIVDTHALVVALHKDEIAGAGIDVFECEPKIACMLEDEKKLRAMPNVILTPHTASATVEARQAMSRVAAENIIAALHHKTPPNAIHEKE